MFPFTVVSLHLMPDFGCALSPPRLTTLKFDGAADPRLAAIEARDGMRVAVRVADAPAARLATVPTVKSSPALSGVPSSSRTAMAVSREPPVLVTVYV